MLPPKYKPTSDIPKFPFFMNEESASGILRTEVIIIPRDWVRPTVKEFPLGADSSMDRMPMSQDSSIFGSLNAPSFGVSSNSHLRTPRFDSYSFGQPAVSMSGSKGKESTPRFIKSSGFGSSHSALIREKDITTLGGAKVQSICGMQTYKY